MSIFSKLWKGVRQIAEPLIRATPIGAALGSTYDAYKSIRPSTARPDMSLLPVAASVGRAVIPRAIAVGKRVLPGVAGAAATQAVLERVTVTGRRAGAAPRRRARGITAAELKGFKRVNGILDKYAKIKPPTRSRSYGVRKCR